MNCLLIDDDLDDQEIFVMALREVNPAIHCMIAKDGQEGLEKLRLLKGQVHDFIFIDLNMPRMSGIQTLIEIKKLDFLQKSKIIIYSTSSDKKTIEAALKAGADQFFVKPPTIAELVSMLAGLFK